MRSARITGFGIGAAALLLPLTALAQAQGGSVTTSPLAQAAPALGGPALIAMAAILAFVAGRFLRLAPKGVAALVVAAAAASLVGVVQAGGVPEVVVDGDECLERTVHPYNSGMYMIVLRSTCANPIEVDAVAPNCDPCEVTPDTSCEDGVFATVLNPCTPGLVLQSGESCELPVCDDK